MKAAKLAAIVGIFAMGGFAAAAEPTSPEALEFFEKKVRPVLVENCVSCHGAKRQEFGLRLGSRAAVLKGSDGGAVVVSGEPEKSTLIEAVRYKGQTKMPPP